MIAGVSVVAVVALALDITSFVRYSRAQLARREANQAAQRASYQNIGRILADQGDLTAALASYQSCTRIREKLAADGPVEWSDSTLSRYRR
jgi:hypothetical protein